MSIEGAPIYFPNSRLTTSTGNIPETENQITIAEWAASVGIFASPSRSLSRANEEMSELITQNTEIYENIDSYSLKQQRDDNTREAIRSVADEAADVVICLFVYAERAGFDLQEAINRKMKKNRGRKWRVDESGVAYHIKE